MGLHFECKRIKSIFISLVKINESSLILNHLIKSHEGGVDRFIYHSPEISGDEDDCTDPEPVDPPIGQTTGCYKVNTRCD